jgi:hypothetical protein
MKIQVHTRLRSCTFLGSVSESACSITVRTVRSRPCAAANVACLSPAHKLVDRRSTYWGTDPAPFANIQPLLMREFQSGLASWEKLREGNFVFDDKNRWAVPDPKKSELQGTNSLVRPLSWLFGVVRHHWPRPSPSYPLLHRTLPGPGSFAILANDPNATMMSN